MSHIPALILAFVRQADPEKPFHQLFKMQRKQREYIAFSTNRLVCTNAKQHQKNSSDKSPDAKEVRQNQCDNPQKFDSIAQFIACLGIVCQNYKGHIK